MVQEVSRIHEVECMVWHSVGSKQTLGVLFGSSRAGIEEGKQVRATLGGEEGRTQ